MNATIINGKDGDWSVDQKGEVKSIGIFTAEAQGSDCTQSAEKVQDPILKEVLDRIEAMSMGVHGILHDLQIDVYDDKYAPMFTSLLAVAVDKYDDQKWRSL